MTKEGKEFSTHNASDEEYRKNIAYNISKLGSPNASIDIVSKIKNHLSYE